MVDGTRRRSARLLALEENKNEREVHHVISMDTGQAMGDERASIRKKGRKKKVTEGYKEAQFPQESGPGNNGDSEINQQALQKQTDRIIEYILDVLEVKDRYELFSMPDDIQIGDYAERVKNPGDFATLRQKHKDGMYKTMEQLESDVCMVFHKAITSNAPNTIPHREAMQLQDQAKQIFQSLRNDRTYSELELSAWHKKYVNNKRTVLRNNGNARTSNYTARSQNSSQTGTHSSMKLSTMAINIAADGRKQPLNDNPTHKRMPQSQASSRPRKRDSAECSKSRKEQRRQTFRPKQNSTPIISMTPKQPVNIVYNTNAPSYKESLLHYVEATGCEAKMAAEQNCLDYAARSKAKSVMPFHYRPHAPNANTSYLSLRSQSSHHNIGPISAGSSAARPKYSFPIQVQDFGDTSLSGSSNSKKDSLSLSGMNTSFPDLDAGPCCKLETEELVSLFSLIGTPEFFERSKTILPTSSSQPRKPDPRFTALLKGRADRTVGAAGQSNNIRVSSLNDQIFTTLFRGAGDHTVGAAQPNYVGVSLMSQERQPLQRKLPKPHSIYDLPFFQPQLNVPTRWEEKGSVCGEPYPVLAPRGLFSSTLRSGEQASSSRQSRPTTLNLFPRP